MLLDFLCISHLLGHARHIAFAHSFIQTLLTSPETLYMPSPGLVTLGAAVRKQPGPCPQDAYILAVLNPVCGGDMTGVSYFNSYFFTLVKTTQTFT